MEEALDEATAMFAASAAGREESESPGFVVDETDDTDDVNHLKSLTPEPPQHLLAQAQALTKTETKEMEEKKMEEQDEEEEGVEEDEEEEEEELEVLDWKAYLAEVGGEPAPEDAFCKAVSGSAENPLKVDMILEARDAQNGSGEMGYGTVLAAHGPFAKIRLLGCDSSNDAWIVFTDPNIAHFGYTKETTGQEPAAPIGYRSTSTHYARFIDRIKNDANRMRLQKDQLPARSEDYRPKENLFKIGMKLEAVDPKNFTGGVYPATIVGSEGDQVELHFDGWKQHNMICRFDSSCLFPLGWAETVKMDMTLPPRGKDGKVKVEMRTGLKSGGGTPATPEGSDSGLGRGRRGARSTAPSTALQSKPSQPKTPKETPASTPKGRNSKKGGEKEPEVVKLPSISPRSDKAPANEDRVEKSGLFDRLGRAPTPPASKESSVEPTAEAEALKSPARARKTLPNSLPTVPDSKANASASSSSAIMRIYVNPRCKSGELINPTLLCNNALREIGPGQVSSVVQRGISHLLDCAVPGKLESLLEGVPGPGKADKGPALTVAADVGDGLLVRPLRVVTDTEAAWDLLSQFLGSAGACPRLLSPSPLACKSCGRKRRRSGSAEETPVGVEDWGVGDVGDFLARHDSDPTLPQTFRTNGIDGKALLLLSPELMMRHMGLRLGPALRVAALVHKLRTRSIS